MQVHVGVTVVVLILMICVGVWITLSREFDSLVLERRAKQQQLVFVNEQVKRVDALEQQRGFFEQSYALIDRLKHQQKIRFCCWIM